MRAEVLHFLMEKFKTFRKEGAASESDSPNFIPDLVPRNQEYWQS